MTLFDLDLDPQSLKDAICGLDSLEEARDAAAAQIVNCLQISVDAKDRLVAAKQKANDDKMIAVKEAQLDGFNLFSEAAKLQLASLESFLVGQHKLIDLIIERIIKERSDSRGQADT